MQCMQETHVIFSTRFLNTGQSSLEECLLDAWSTKTQESAKKRQSMHGAISSSELFTPNVDTDDDEVIPGSQPSAAQGNTKFQSTYKSRSCKINVPPMVSSPVLSSTPEVGKNIYSKRIVTSPVSTPITSLQQSCNAIAKKVAFTCTSDFMTPPLQRVTTRNLSFLSTSTPDTVK